MAQRELPTPLKGAALCAGTLIFEPTQGGKNWSNAHTEHQLQHLAMLPFGPRWPGHLAVFLYDGATNRTAFSLGALRVGSMNLSPRGNQNHDMVHRWNPPNATTAANE